MDVFPIRSEADHRLALERVAALMGTAPGTPESAELEVWATLVDAYESDTFPLEEGLDPPELLKAHMTANGYTMTDLAGVLESASQAQAILDRASPLTLSMIRSLERAWGLPAVLLIAEYPLRKTPKGTGRKRSAAGSGRQAA